jgi:hypothetical protein
MKKEAKFYKIEDHRSLDFYMVLPSEKVLNVFLPNNLLNMPLINVSKECKKIPVRYAIGSIEFMEAYEKAKAQLKEFDEVLSNYPKKS